MILIKRPLLLSFAALSLWLVGCSDSPKVKPEIEALAIEAQVDRFDQKFASASDADLSALKAEFPSLFPAQYPDEFWLEKKRDTLLLALNQEVDAKFPDFDDYQQDLSLLFKHLKHYFPTFEAPRIYTVISEVDYKDPILVFGKEMIIGLDNYLGADHPFYQGIPLYISANMRPEQIVPDAASLLAKNYIPPARDRSFLGQMIYHGKLLYLESLLLPLESEHEIMGYTEAQWQWTLENEQDIWRYFVEREVLFNTDPKLMNRFISPAPFSKFYLEIDNESPGRIGRYMGWQMVKAYAENTGASLGEVLSKPAAELYQQSKYKPSK